MKQKIFLSIAILCLLSLVVFVSAQDCTDSDNGKDYSIKGTVYDEREDPISMDDYCYDDSQLFEHWCMDEGYAAELITCPNGCKDGACLTGSNVCTDSDNGKDYYEYGYVIRPDRAEEQDYCMSGAYIEEGTLRERFCIDNQIQSKDYVCPNGCEDGKCIGFAENIEPVEKPEDLPEDDNTNRIDYICNGCELDGKCYPFNYRKSGEYCSIEQEFIPQLKSDSTCENNFECSSNLCIDGQCISSSFWQKIVNFFKNLFG